MISCDIVFIDIETLPTNDPDLIAAIEADVTPPGSMKKKETIEAWWENEGAEAKREAVRKTSLDGGTGRLAALAWGWSDQPIVSAHTAVDGAWSIDRERQILKGFFDELDGFRAENKVPPTIVGHNISGFDIRWLWKRSICLGIRPPHWWPIDARPWDADRVQDTMVMWCGSKDRISQDRLARTLGIRGKGAIDGSQVADLWDASEHEAIRLYCADDVSCVRKIWCRIVGEDAPLDEEELEELFASMKRQLASRPENDPLFLDETEDEVVRRVVEVVPVQDKPAETRGKVIPPFLLDGIKEKAA